MTDWTENETERIAGAREFRIATKRKDGSVRSFVPIWVVSTDGDLFIRAYHGPSGSWYRQARRSGRAMIRAGGVEREVSVTPVDDSLRARIDTAYREKYGHGMYADAMVTPEAAAATLRLVPIS